MATNILAVFCAMIALVVGGFVIWAEIGPDKKNDDKEKEDLNNSK